MKYQLGSTYPWSSESNQDVLVLIQYDLVKVGRGKLDSGGRCRGLDLGFDARLVGDADN
jgi:hypothetical protein